MFIQEASRLLLAPQAVQKYRALQSRRLKGLGEITNRDELLILISLKAGDLKPHKVCQPIFLNEWLEAAGGNFPVAQVTPRAHLGKGR